jgi:putative glutamine amidotransferase
VRPVAVSQRIDDHPQRSESRDALDRRLIELIVATGHLPVPVPNDLPLAAETGVNLNAWLAAVRPCAVLLSGGGDPGHQPARDATESRLLDHALAHGLPVLGLCRGMQVLGLRARAQLRTADGHVGTRHRLVGLLHGDVNSYHRMVLATCPDGYEVLARSGDGEIEAIRHDTLPWEGWMWHPEREPVFRTTDVERMRTLFNA